MVSAPSAEASALLSNARATSSPVPRADSFSEVTSSASSFSSMAENRLSEPSKKSSTSVAESAFSTVSPSPRYGPSDPSGKVRSTNFSPKMVFGRTTKRAATGTSKPGSMARVTRA